VTKSHVVKLADWGLCRYEAPRAKARLTNPVVTLWYRAPELLLGTARYGKAVDMWSCGAILVELLTGKPFIEGRDEVDQLHRVFDMCGTPEYDGQYSGPRFARRTPRLAEELRKRCVLGCVQMCVCRDAWVGCVCVRGYTWVGGWWMK
jgi:serine/threonine protein kinase